MIRETKTKFHICVPAVREQLLFLDGIALDRMCVCAFERA